ncbi:MAG: hypothetical protein JSW39_11045 [Desulfobacterales bacterium]|nr:MAG: hypothetical protein JSW39_11045 [Desulfobacterales bacterium]
MPNATVPIDELDQGGNGHDLMFSLRTGANGKFGGTIGGPINQQMDADAMRIQDEVAPQKYLAEGDKGRAGQVDSFREMRVDRIIKIESFP